MEGVEAAARAPAEVPSCEPMAVVVDVSSTTSLTTGMLVVELVDGVSAVTAACVEAEPVTADCVDAEVTAH